MDGVVGRDRELETIWDFLDRQRGTRRVLLLAGEAGIGKTTLWRAAVDAAREHGYQALTSSASPAETRLAFAAIGDILGPHVDDVLGTLPPPQARALAVALRRADVEGAAPDPATIAFAVLGSLRQIAASAPVLVAVDDVQWLDGPSTAALAFALRRLDDADDVRFLFAQRAAGDTAPPLGIDRYPEDRIERVAIGPLSRGAIAAVVTGRLGTALPRPTLHRVHGTANGNPFFAVELARALLRLGGDVAPDEPLPVPASLDELLAARLLTLPDATRAALVPVAALRVPTLELVAESLAVRDPEARLQPAIDAHVLAIDGHRIRFTHPLLAAAVYAQAGRRARRETHRALARVATTVEERARHLALGADEPDAEIAAALEEAARATDARGHRIVSAELYEGAARFTPETDAADHARRVLAAAAALFDAGDANRAAASLESLLEETTDSAARIESQLLLGRILADVGRWREAMDLWAEALESTDEPAAVADIRSSMAVMSIYAGSANEAIVHADEAVAAARRCADDATRQAYAYAARAMAGVAAGEGSYRALLEVALELEPLAEPRTSAWNWSPTNAAAACALHAFDVEEIRLRFGAMLAQGADSGNTDLEQYGAYGLAYAELAAGNPGRAKELSDIVDELGSATGVLHLPGGRLRAEIDAHLGRAAEARARLVGVISESEAVGERRYTWQARAALGALELAEGRAAAAAEQLRAARRLAEEIGMRDPSLVASFVDEIEAAAEAGLLDQAEEALVAARRLGSQPNWSPPILARADAVVAARRGRLEEAETGLAGAHGAWTLPLQRGRTLLALGSVQRRMRRRSAARASLQDALATFEQLGARLWAERAREELGRIGGRRAAVGELTTTERRIAELVAEGKTNKEVAAILVVADRTIESALTQIYRKLGVRSRTQLPRKLAGTD